MLPDIPSSIFEVNLYLIFSWLLLCFFTNLLWVPNLLPKNWSKRSDWLCLSGVQFPTFSLPGGRFFYGKGMLNFSATCSGTLGIRIDFRPVGSKLLTGSTWSVSEGTPPPWMSGLWGIGFAGSGLETSRWAFSFLVFIKSHQKFHTTILCLVHSHQ